MNETGRSSPLVPPSGWLRVDAPVATPGAGFLLLATLLAAALRLYGLTAQSLWVDEVMTWTRVRPDAGLQLLVQLRDNIQGPLYLAVIWPLVRLADTELMLRLPAALAGIAAVPAFGAVAGRLVDARAARLATLLLAINPFHVWYSQEARGYAFLVLFTVLAGWCWLEMARRGPSPRRAVLLAAALAGAVWSNMAAVFLWAALALTVPLLRPAGARAWGAWALAFGGGLLAASPWLAQAAGIWAVDRLAPGAATGEALRGATTFTPAAWPYTLYALCYGFSLGPSLRELHDPERMALLVSWLPLLVAAALPVVLGLAGGLGNRRRRTGLLLVWIAVPWLLLTLLAVRNFKPWNARYLAVVLPWVLVLVSHGLLRLPRRLGIAATILLCALTLASLAGHHAWPRYAKADVRGAAAWIRSAGDDLPVLVPDVGGVYRYYDRDRVPILAAWGVRPLRDADAADRFVATQLAGHDAAWVVLAREWRLDPRGLLVPALERAGTVVREPPRTGVRLLRWTRARGAAEAGDGR